MTNRLRKWLAPLAAAYPSAFSPYWRALPLGRMKSLLAGAFLTGSVAGFAADLLQIHTRPLVGGWYWPISLGLVASGILVTRIKNLRLVLPGIGVTLLILVTGAARLPASMR